MENQEAMSVTPYDQGTFLVSSRSRPEMQHLVDLAYCEEPWMKPRPYCGCEDCHAKDGHICKHIEAVVAYEQAQKTITPSL